MITNDISWSLGSTPNKSLVQQPPLGVGLVTRLLFRFTSRVTYLRHLYTRTAYANRRHSLPVSFRSLHSGCNTIAESNIPLNRPPPTGASIDRFSIAPDRSQTPAHQGQFTPDRFLKSLRIHESLVLNTCDTNHPQPFPIAIERSDRFFNSNQYSQSGPNIPDLSSPIAHRHRPSLIPNP